MNALRLFCVLAMLIGMIEAHAAELGKADRIVVLKSARILELVREGAVLKTYPIALGPHPKGAKHRLGDGRTPEGVYAIDRRTRKTPYRRALHISYPNQGDLDYARRHRLAAGDAIFIHGMPAYFGRTDPARFFVDWTDGCIAVGNIAIEEIWDAVDDGTPVDIRP